jgi:SagB-type dehydrogenase family enzyme
LTRDLLARLLYLTNGDTETNDGDPYRLRAAPSAGALYAGELYVVALSVADLERGVYYYDVGAHDLIRIRDEPNPPDFADAFEDPTTATGAAALVLITNVFERYETRYSNRGYRYALVDTGHIGENLRIAAAGAGIEHRAEPRFVDAQLNALLQIDGNDEAVCAVHALGGIAAKDAIAAGTPSANVVATETGGAAAAGMPAAGGEASRRRFVEKAATGAHINDDSDPTVRYHDATALVVGNARRASDDSGESASTDSQKQASSTQVVTLANLEPAPATPAEGCIVSRRSPMGFAQQAISGAQLGFVTRAAYPAEAARRSIGLELQLVVHRVQGVDSGLYRYVPSQPSLEVIRIDDYTDSLPRVCLGQSKAGDAAVGFLMVARIRAAAAEHGERAYRDLLIEAGEVGERIYLAAEALGLSARNLAAFIDEDLNSLIGARRR